MVAFLLSFLGVFLFTLCPEEHFGVQNFSNANMFTPNWQILERKKSTFWGIDFLSVTYKITRSDWKHPVNKNKKRSGALLFCGTFKPRIHTFNDSKKLWKFPEVKHWPLFRKLMMNCLNSFAPQNHEMMISKNSRNFLIKNNVGRPALNEITSESFSRNNWFSTGSVF